MQSAAIRPGCPSVLAIRHTGVCLPSVSGTRVSICPGCPLCPGHTCAQCPSVLGAGALSVLAASQGEAGAGAGTAPALATAAPGCIRHREATMAPGPGPTSALTIHRDEELDSGIHGSWHSLGVSGVPMAHQGGFLGAFGQVRWESLTSHSTPWEEGMEEPGHHLGTGTLNKCQTLDKQDLATTKPSGC